jgi:hypothetical protein
LPNDQRGVPRIGTVDIGAFEYSIATAAQTGLIGRVLSADGKGIKDAVITVNGRTLPEPKVVRTGGSGKYSVDGLPAGYYVATVEAKGYSFASPSVFVNMLFDTAELNFMAEQSRNRLH